MERVIVGIALVFAAAFAPLSSARAVDWATDPFALQLGQYRWHPEVAPEGPLVVVVSLDEQRVYVYRNGIAIGLGTISSGRRGHSTPTGVFTILQKQRIHHSNLYDDASMPFMERLTWDGIAMHGGKLPGYPASHGCVRLPQGFAERLFAITRSGETVVVADSDVSPVTVVHPPLLAPVSSIGIPEASADDAGTAPFWKDAEAAEGPVSILVSVRDRTVYVVRNGIRIRSSALTITESFEFRGSVVFVRLGDPVIPGVDGVPSSRWSAYPLDGETAPDSMERLASQLKVSDDFVRHLESVIVPGTRVLVTDLPAVRPSPSNEGAQAVMESEPTAGATLGTGEEYFPPLASPPRVTRDGRPK